MQRQHRQPAWIAEFREGNAPTVGKAMDTRGAVLGAGPVDRGDGVHGGDCNTSTKAAVRQPCADYSQPMMMSPGLIISTTGLPS